jgi:hypothetical protein
VECIRGVYERSVGVQESVVREECMRETIDLKFPPPVPLSHNPLQTDLKFIVGGIGLNPRTRHAETD